MKQLKLLLAAGLLYAGIPVQAQWMYIQSASYSSPGGNSFDVTNKIISLCRGANGGNNGTLQDVVSFPVTDRALGMISGSYLHRILHVKFYCYPAPPPNPVPQNGPPLETRVNQGNIILNSSVENPVIMLSI